MFAFQKDASETEIAPGVTRKVLAYNEDLMVCHISIKPGSTVPAHKHVHTQSSYIISGRVEATVGGETAVLGAGDNILMPSDVEHVVIALEETVVLDIFTPMRADFVGR